VGRVVTEYGVAEPRGSSISDQTRKLIARPNLREGLERKAGEIYYL